MEIIPKEKFKGLKKLSEADVKLIEENLKKLNKLKDRNSLKLWGGFIKKTGCLCVKWVLRKIWL